ncbi:hypothetical protein Tco_1293857 [Tanacetum coccineum]
MPSIYRSTQSVYTNAASIGDNSRQTGTRNQRRVSCALPNHQHFGMGEVAWIQKYEETDSDILYAVPIKEDTAYLCLLFTKDHEGTRFDTPYPEEVYTLYSRYSNKIFWKISKVVPTSRNPPIRRIDLNQYTFILVYVLLYATYHSTGSSDTDQIASLVGPAGDPWDQRVRSQLIGKDLASELLVYELPLSKPILKKYMENAQADSNPTETNTNDDMNIKLSKEFLMELKSNAYHEMFDEDVVDHIAKVLEILDLISIPGVDSHQLRMKVFPLSLADDARQWWINEGEGKITTWEELVENFFCKFYPESHDGEDEMLDEGDN